MTKAYWILRALARLLIATQMRLLRVTGRERVPATGSVLLVSNHLGPTDPLPIGVHLRRQVRIMAKAEIFRWPVLGWIARWARAVPIRRGESDREALRIVSRLLTAGECVLVFPEGTYADPPAPPAMLRVKTGAAWLALRTGATVVPVGIWGTEKVWARGWRPWKLLWRRPRAGIVFGEPFRLTLPPGVSMKEALGALADDMARRIAALLPEAYQGVYASAAPAPALTTERRETIEGAEVSPQRT